MVRIVAAADCYDAMTGHRAYRKRAMSGHEALQRMICRDGDRFDPAVLWQLVHCVGLYPAGTVYDQFIFFRQFYCSGSPDTILVMKMSPCLHSP